MTKIYAIYHQNEYESPDLVSAFFNLEKARLRLKKEAKLCRYKKSMVSDAYKSPGPCHDMLYIGIINVEDDE